MNIREALEKIIRRTSQTSIEEDLAPKIEAALRAAYGQGYKDGVFGRPGESEANPSERGVTVGIEKLGEESS